MLAFFKVEGLGLKKNWVYSPKYFEFQTNPDQTFHLISFYVKLYKIAPRLLQYILEHS